MNLSSMSVRLRQSLRAFKSSERGNVIMTFALTMVPICGLIGAAVDYTRANNARSQMQSALDSVSLMISKDAANLTSTALQTKAQAYFNALYTRTDTATPTIAASYTASSSIGSKVVVSGASSMSTTFLKVMGISSLNINSSSTAAWGNVRMRVALALDTTGSMASDGKMTALKPAAKSLIDQISGIAKNTGDVYISLVPFNKDVNVGTGNKNATWIDWSDWENVNGSCSNGWNASKNSCQNNGKTWTPANRNIWQGCVTDRDQPYDIQNTVPSVGNTATLFTAEQYSDCEEALVPLTYNWTTLKNKVDAMSSNGNTNQGIGLAWAWHTLNQGDPFSAPAEDVNYKYSKVIILMSDGLNTQNRWSSNETTINNRQKLLCDNIKASGVTIYTIHVNTDNDPTSSVLQYCASGTDKFFVLTSANQLATTFTKIGDALSRLRIAY